MNLSELQPAKGSVKKAKRKIQHLKLKKRYKKE